MNNYRGFTFKRIFGIFWAIIYVVIVLLYVVTQTIVMKQATNNIEKNIKLSVTSSETSIEKSLEMTDLYLYENYYLSSPGSLSNLCYTYLYDENEVERVSALETISHIVSSIPSWNNNVSFAMLYILDDEKGTWLDAGDRDNYPVRVALKNVIELYENNSDKSVLKRYMLFPCDNKRNILRVMVFDRCYFVVGLSENSILSLLEKGKYSDDSICFAVDEDGMLIFSDEAIDSVIDYNNDGKYVNIGGREYLQVGYRSDATNYYFGILTDKKSIEKEMNGTRFIFVIVLLFLTALFLGSRLLVYYQIEKPITSTIGKMAEVNNADDINNIEIDTPIKEFRVLADSFNKMAENIRTLKIENYESELEKQKATMQYLQLQIKPHFYANLLNIIYSLAQSRDFETIQRVSKAIVNYSRYMFRDATDLVELKREIEFLNCYMEIQEIRYRKQISLELDIPEDLDETYVPPFIIQSFVENSVKYAFSSKKNCVIRVNARLSDDMENMFIIISDNGSGYPKELLDTDWKNEGFGEHIGLKNVYKRLRLIYEEKADICLENDDGAKSTITLPFINVGLYDDL